MGSYGMRYGIQSTEVVEYLGMPGVGKSWQMAHAEGANAHIVPTGQDTGKWMNTLRGIMSSPLLLLLLIRAAWLNRRIPRRPMFVIFERLGRCRRIELSGYDSVVHIDEGALQFVWRFFCDLQPTQRNRERLHRCVEALDFAGHRVVYVWCPLAVHIERVKARGKSQPFDRSLLEGDSGYVQRCRAWMGCLLRSARSVGVDVRIIRQVVGNE